MTDAECVRFLQWALPRMGMRWPGFRKVRRGVCKRIARRMKELGLPDPRAYRAFLESHPEEWRALDALCRVSISRFLRDRGEWKRLEEEVLPRLAENALSGGERALRAWSAGCASGEEPYTLSVIWGLSVEPEFPELALAILATEVDRTMLGRAQEACYGTGSLKEAPRAWLAAAFTETGGLFCVRPAFRGRVAFRRQDIRKALPDGPFDLILCRNLVFTYFDTGLQGMILARVLERLVPGGALVIGHSEALPERPMGLSDWGEGFGVYRKAESAG